MLNITLTAVIAFLLASIIVVWVVCVLFKLDRKRHQRGYAHFSGFGYSYVLLGGGAASAALSIGLDNDFIAGLSVWFFLAGSAGLIVFDRRQRRHHERSQMG